MQKDAYFTTKNNLEVIKVMIQHFGIRIKEKDGGLKLIRDNYIYQKNKTKSSLPCFKKFQGKSCDHRDENCKFYKEEWINEYEGKVLENFDLNMQYFATLNKEKFKNETTIFLKNNSNFKDVTDLSIYNRSGYYVMILGEYCQVYIGTSKNIKKRIMRHWNENKYFDTLLFPMNAVDTSIMSINSFEL